MGAIAVLLVVQSEHFPMLALFCRVRRTLAKQCRCSRVMCRSATPGRACRYRPWHAADGVWTDRRIQATQVGLYCDTAAFGVTLMHIIGTEPRYALSGVRGDPQPAASGWPASDKD